MSIAIADEAIEGGSSATYDRMEKAAFLALYEQTAPRLRNYLRRAARDAALADDLLQEAFCRLLRAPLPPLDLPQMTAYLFRTATSLLNDHWRRTKRERRWRLLFRREDRISEKHPWSPDLNAIFATMKPREQALLWLAYVEGFDHREIAFALQLSERSIRVLLFRARKKLAALCAQNGIGPEQIVLDAQQKGSRKG